MSVDSQIGAAVVTRVGHSRFAKGTCGKALYLTEGSRSMVMGLVFCWSVAMMSIGPLSGWPRLTRSQCHAQGRVSRRRRRALPRMAVPMMQNVALGKGGVGKLRDSAVPCAHPAATSAPAVRQVSLPSRRREGLGVGIQRNGKSIQRQRYATRA